MLKTLLRHLIAQDTFKAFYSSRHFCFSPVRHFSIARHKYRRLRHLFFNSVNKVILNLECLIYQNIYILFHHILYSYSHFDSNKCKKRSNRKKSTPYIGSGSQNKILFYTVLYRNQQTLNIFDAKEFNQNLKIIFCLF